MLDATKGSQVTEIFVSNPEVMFLEERDFLYPVGNTAPKQSVEKPWKWGDSIAPSLEKIKEEEAKGQCQVVITRLPIKSIGSGK